MNVSYTVCYLILRGNVFQFCGTNEVFKALPQVGKSHEQDKLSFKQLIRVVSKKPVRDYLIFKQVICFLFCRPNKKGGGCMFLIRNNIC